MTKDVLDVQRLLGHRHIGNNLKYIDFETALFGATIDQFTVRVANDVKEAYTLTEAGFEYVTQMEGYKLFRKRKSTAPYRFAGVVVQG